MAIRNSESVEELKIDAGSETGVDPTKRIVELERAVDRSSAEVHRGLVGENERGDRERKKNRDPDSRA